jgi:hypothetical protein
VLSKLTSELSSLDKSEVQLSLWSGWRSRVSIFGNGISWSNGKSDCRASPEYAWANIDWAPVRFPPPLLRHKLLRMRKLFPELADSPRHVFHGGIAKSQDQTLASMLAQIRRREGPEPETFGRRAGRNLPVA